MVYKLNCKWNFPLFLRHVFKKYHCNNCKNKVFKKIIKQIWDNWKCPRESACQILGMRIDFEQSYGVGFFRLGFWKKTNLIQWLCVRACVRTYVRTYVCSPLGNFYESIYSHVYSGEWSLRGVSNDFFLNFSKISIFGCLAAIFR